MKYNININQLFLSKTNLDLADCAILDYVYIYCNSSNKKIEHQRIREDGEIWTWINFNTLKCDMPLLRIKSISSISARIKKLEQAGYITTKRFLHQKLFIKLNDKVDELFVEQNENKKLSRNQNSYDKKLSRNQNSLGGSCSESRIDSYSESRTNNSTNIDNYTIDNYTRKKISKIENKATKEDIDLARLLESKIRERMPKLQKTNINHWSDDIRKMHTIDKRSYNDILGAILFSQQDDFWQSVILSASKVRKHFDKLLAQYQRTGKRKAGLKKVLDSIKD